MLEIAGAHVLGATSPSSSLERATWQNFGAGDFSQFAPAASSPKVLGTVRAQPATRSSLYEVRFIQAALNFDHGLETHQ